MEFRRISNLPPYVFTIINNLKIEARRAGVDVIDLGFGNPDIPSPQIAVDKLAEAAHIARNHRYSLSRGLPKLREARRRIDAHQAAGGQPIWLEVDGGVKTGNIGTIVAAGADTLVAGSAVFGAPDADKGYRTIMQDLRSAAARPE